MSHKATNWAVQVRGIRPSAKVLLWHLADRHNPDGGCFPSHEKLVEDTEISRSQINVLLKELEVAGLIRRVQRKDPHSHRQMSTRYLLAFEEEFSAVVVEADVHDPPRAVAPEPGPETGHGAESGSGAEPSPVLGKSRVRKSDTNPVREPVKEPAGARAAGAGAAPGTLPCPEGLTVLRSIWPKDSAPKRTALAWKTALDLTGGDPAPILAAARAHIEAEKARPSRGRDVMPLFRWLLEGGKGAEAVPSPNVHDGVARHMADLVNKGRYVAPSAISTRLAGRMVELGLVSPAQLRAIGVAA